MISETGRNLSVLIISETGLDWQTFATWYSFYKNLPEATVALFCNRNSDFTFVYFQWAKRLKIPTIKTKPTADNKDEYINWLFAIKKAQDVGLVKQPILAVKPCVMAVDALNNNWIKKLEKNIFWLDDCALYLKDQQIEDLINNYYLEDKLTERCSEKLCVDAKFSNDVQPFVNYKKGCGRWIDTAIGCPFSSAGGLINSELTANETRVIELWKKMVPLYQAVV
jgi:hypothetical protein